MAKNSRSSMDRATSKKTSGKRQASSKGRANSTLLELQKSEDFGHGVNTALTFDDVLLVPQYRAQGPTQVSTTPNLRMEKTGKCR